MMKKFVYPAGASAKQSRRSKANRSIRQSTTYSATYVAALKARNRIYLAIVLIKAVAIILLAMGGYCE